MSVSDKPPEPITSDAHVVLFRAPERGRPRPPMLEHLRPDADRLITRQADNATWLETHALPTPRILLYCLPKASSSPAP